MHEIASPVIAAILEKGVLGLTTFLGLGLAYVFWGRLDARDKEIKALNELRVAEMKLALETVNQNTSQLSEAREDYERMVSKIPQRGEAA